MLLEQWVHCKVVYTCSSVLNYIQQTLMVFGVSMGVFHFGAPQKYNFGYYSSLKSLMQQTPSDAHLSRNSRCCDVRGAAVLCGRHTTVLLLLVLILTLHTLVFCLLVWAGGGWRGEGWRRRWQVLQGVMYLLHLDNGVPQQVDGVRQSG